MLTMLPVQVSVPGGLCYPAAMLYAIATHPRWQGRGFSTRLMGSAKEYLKGRGVEILALVPAEASLVEFYKKRGYRPGFKIREVVLSAQDIQSLRDNCGQPTIVLPAAEDEYNTVRNQFLRDRIYIAYSDNEISYQKRLSRRTGADIFICKNGCGTIGCAAIERIGKNKIIVKELLAPERYVKQAVAAIAQTMPAQQYLLRLPPEQGEGLGGIVRTFGMLEILNEDIKGEAGRASGYLGIAFD